MCGKGPHSDGRRCEGVDTVTARIVASSLRSIGTACSVPARWRLRRATIRGCAATVCGPQRRDRPRRPDRILAPHAKPRRRLDAQIPRDPRPRRRRLARAVVIRRAAGPDERGGPGRRPAERCRDRARDRQVQDRRGVVAQDHSGRRPDADRDAAREPRAVARRPPRRCAQCRQQHRCTQPRRLGERAHLGGARAADRARRRRRVRSARPDAAALRGSERPVLRFPAHRSDHPADASWRWPARWASGT